MSLKQNVLRGASALSLLVLVPVAAQAQRYTLGEHAAIYDLVGQVKLVPGSGAAVVAEVSKLGGDAGKLRLETGAAGKWQVLRVVFPDDDIVYDRMRSQGGSTTLDVRADGTFNDRGFWRNEGLAEPSGDGHRVRISGHGSGLHAYADVVVQVPAGRQVMLNLGVGRLEATNVNGTLRLSTSSGDAVVDHVQGSLNLSSGSGDLRLTELSGDAVVATGSGDVTVQGSRGAKLNLATGSGDVTAAGISATLLDVSTGSGDLKLESVSAPRAKVSSGSGDINLGLVAALEDLNASSGSGDVTLGVPANTGAKLRVSTGSGDIETDIPVTMTARRHNELVGTIGDGRGSIVVSTGSGDVRLNRR